MRKQCHRQVRDPMGWITKRTPLAEDQQRDLGVAYRIALQAMLRGSGTEQTWSTLACAFNIALILAEDGVSANAVETIKLAQDALMNTKARAERTGKWAFDGDGIRVVLAVANIHDEQLEVAKRSQIVDAIKEVHRRLTTGETL